MMAYLFLFDEALSIDDGGAEEVFLCRAGRVFCLFRQYSKLPLLRGCDGCVNPSQLHLVCGNAYSTLCFTLHVDWRVLVSGKFLARGSVFCTNAMI